MQTLIATLALFALVMAAMAVGLMLKGRSLPGSCGGTGEGCACSETKRRACVAAAREADG